MSETILTEVPWETRNLGLPSFTIKPEAIRVAGAEGLGNALAATLRKHGRYFVQTRVGIRDYCLLPLLTRNGFYAIETVLTPVCDPVTNAALHRFGLEPALFLPGGIEPDSVRVTSANRADQDLCAGLQVIATGSFAHDRFHLDPRCSRTIADARFKNWMADLWADVTVDCEVLYRRNSLAGFMARRGGDLILAGFGAEYAGAGLGEYLWLSAMNNVRAAGIGRISTLVSANNAGVINLYSRLGFRFRNPAMTLHLWVD